MPSLPDNAQPAVADVIRERVEDALGLSALEWVTPDTGLSAALRCSVTLGDGTSVFVKAATDEQTERWLRTEYLALQHVPERFVPDVVAWLDEPGSYPILIVEDLRRAHWPASHQGVDWREGDIDRVIAAVADLSRVQAPEAFAQSSRVRRSGRGCCTRRRTGMRSSTSGCARQRGSPTPLPCSLTPKPAWTREVTGWSTGIFAATTSASKPSVWFSWTGAMSRVATLSRTWPCCCPPSTSKAVQSLVT